MKNCIDCEANLATNTRTHWSSRNTVVATGHLELQIFMFFCNPAIYLGETMEMCLA